MSEKNAYRAADCGSNDPPEAAEVVTAAQGPTDAEWAASLTVEDVDLLINRCVKAKDMRGIGAALHLMAVKDPRRAEHWRDTLLLAVDVARATTVHGPHDTHGWGEGRQT